jgi:DNA-binding beta-propeller fold protein YncE
MKKSLILIIVLLAHSLNAQKLLKGFYQTPSYIEKAAVDNTIVGYGMDFIEYGKIPSYHKVVIWDSLGEVREEIDLTSLFSFVHRENNYKGQFVACQLSPDKKNILVVGRNYQFQGDAFETIIHSYSIETRKWTVPFVNKEYQCLKLAFHPTNSDIMVAYATSKVSKNNEFEVFLFDMKQNTMTRKIKTYSFPNIPISIHFSKDGERLFVFEGKDSGVGNMDVFSTSNYISIKRILVKDHILKVFETPKELYFCGANKTFLYSKKDFAYKRALSFNDVKGVYPESNFMLVTEHSSTGAAPKSAFYNLTTQKISYWTSQSGSELLQLYDAENSRFIAFNIIEFFQYDENYKRNFSPPALENLTPSVILHKFDVETILKQ